MKSAIALLTASAVLASTTAEDPSITRRRVASDGAKPMKGSARRWRRVQAPNKGLQKKISNDLAPHRLGDYGVPGLDQNGNNIVFAVDGDDLQQLQQSMPIEENNFDFDGKPSMKGSEMAGEGASSDPPGTKQQADSKGGGAPPAPAPEPAGGPAGGGPAGGGPVGGPAGEPAAEPATKPGAEPAAEPAVGPAAEPVSETDVEISSKGGGGGTEGLEFASENDLDGEFVSQELATSDNGAKTRTASVASVVGGALLMAL